MPGTDESAKGENDPLTWRATGPRQPVQLSAAAHLDAHFEIPAIRLGDPSVLEQDTRG